MTEVLKTGLQWCQLDLWKDCKEGGTPTTHIQADSYRCKGHFGVDIQAVLVVGCCVTMGMVWVWLWCALPGVYSSCDSSHNGCHMANGLLS